MSITEQERNELHNTLQEALGSGPASTLMSYLPPVGWADVATKRDLDALRTEMQSGFNEVRAEMQGGFNEVRAELYRAMNAQTKGLFFSVAGLNVTIAGLVFAALRFT